LHFEPQLFERFLRSLILCGLQQRQLCFLMVLVMRAAKVFPAGQQFGCSISEQRRRMRLP
jgi:hypothetical protein